MFGRFPIKRFYSQFKNRHIGIKENQLNDMLRACNVSDLDNLMNEIVPDKISTNLNFFNEKSEVDSISDLNNIMNKNNIDRKIYYGQGYSPTRLPSLLQRLILENPKWYTSYTPYQAEISQGRLESLHNYQTLITELTGLPTTNASLLDEATSAVEAINMSYNYSKKKRSFFLFQKLSSTNFEYIKA